MDPLRLQHQRSDGTLPLPERIKIAVPAVLATISTYNLAGKPVRPPLHPRATWLDTAIPFIPESIFVYMPAYLMGFILLLFLVNHGRAFRSAAFTLVLFNLLAIPFFVLMPIASPRPVLSGDLSGTLGLVNLLYSVDTPYNTFPSLHVSCSSFVAYVLSRTQKTHLGWVLAASIWVSILTMKQHWAIDLAGGLVLCGVGVAVYEVLVPLERKVVEQVVGQVRELARQRIR
jgi:hypothetical protein